MRVAALLVLNTYVLVSCCDHSLRTCGLLSENHGESLSPPALLRRGNAAVNPGQIY